MAELTADGLDVARSGLDISLEAEYTPDGVGAADAEVAAAVQRIPEASAPRRSVYTLPGLVTVGPPPLRNIGPPSVLFGDDAALDAVAVVERGPDDGVWVTTWFAERHGLEVGDVLAFEAGAIVDEQWNDLVQGGGAATTFRIGATYEPLWSEQPAFAVDDFWDDVPPEIVPRYVRPLSGPNIELMLLSEGALLDSGLTGVVRWRAPLTTVPIDFDGLRQLRDRTRALELALVGTGPLADRLDAIQTSAGRGPTLTTDLFDNVAAAESAADQLEGPLAAAQAVGAAVGLVAVIAVGFFLVERRRSEYRLLASEGERWPTMSARVAAQLAAPICLGALAGVALALVVARWAGPAQRLAVDVIPWGSVAVITLLALVLASLVAGTLGARSLDSPTRFGIRSAAPLLVPVLVVGTAGAWVQADRTATTEQGRPDLVVVALPVLGILTTILVLVTGLVLLLRRWGGRLERLPTEAYLAASRIARGSVGLAVVVGALGLGVGLLVFSAALTSTLDRTVEVKLATEIGGETKVNLVDDLPDDFISPAPTTVVFTSDTALTPGGQRARVIAIDAPSYVDAVIWPEQFGADLDDVIDALSLPADDSLPVVAIDGEPGPTNGAFGLTQTLPYRVVDRIPAFPGAGDAAITLLVLADAVDEMGLANSDFTTREAASSAGYLLPTERFRQRAISRAPAAELTAALELAGVRYGEVVSQSERNREPRVVANRAAFGFLATVGGVAVAGALGSLTLYLSARRRERALASVMTRTMGLSAPRAAATTVLEITTLFIVAVAAGFVAAPALVGRLSDRFDPAPDRPPRVPVLVDWTPFLLAAGIGVVALATVLWVSELASARRPASEVVRDG